MGTTSIAQVNVRMDRGLKERGDATLRLAGSTPARVIRQLWERLALGGDAYERVMDAILPAQDKATVDEAHHAVQQSARLFGELGESLGLDSLTFEPDLRPEKDILEEIEWELLEGKDLI